MQLFAIDITHLTDARYFAARGAELIVFNPQLSSIESIHAMKSWLDVPHFGMTIPQNASIDEVMYWLAEIEVRQLIIPYPTAEFVSDLHGYTRHMMVDDLPVSLPEWVDSVILPPTVEIPSIHVPIYWYLDEARRDIEVRHQAIEGIVLSGSSEDKIGIKSYDTLDDLLDGWLIGA